MRYLKYVALLAVLMVPLAYSQAQVSVGIGVAAGPPACSYGYYNYYPYACAPYGYYGPSYFVNGIFIGAGPWYHWGHPAWFWNRGYYGRGWVGRPGWGYRGGYVRENFNHAGFVGGRPYSGGGFHGGQAFHGGGQFHSAGGYHGGGGFHGGGRH